IAKALTHADVYARSRPLVVGERRALEAAIRITGGPLEVRVMSEPDSAGEHPGTVDLIDLANIDIEQVGRARVSPAVGHAAYEYLERATQLALQGRIGAVVTAPL